MNPFQLEKLNREEQELFKARNLQPTLEGTTPLNDNEFVNSLQMEEGQPDLRLNELFQNIPGGYNTSLPKPADELSMEPMVIEPENNPEQQLKAKLQKFQALRKPTSAPVKAETPQLAKPNEARPEAKPDDMYMNQGISKMIQGLASMGGGKIDDNADFYEKYRDFQSKKPMQELELKTKQRNFDRMTKMDDPTSVESRNFRKALQSLPYGQELAKMYGADWEGISANDKETIFDVIRTKENIEARKEQAQILASQRAESREDRNFQKDLIRGDKKEQELNKDIQKFQDKTQDTRNILGAVNDFETVLGRNLDTIESDKSGNLKEGGKKLDLPGASVPGIGRVSFYNADARKLSDAAAKIFNVELKSRSGAAVTDNELTRMRKEFSDGKFNTEAELIDAVKRYQARTRIVLKQEQGGFKPDVVKIYKERTEDPSMLDTSGEKRIQGSSKKSSASFPMQVRKDGKVTTVTTEAELEEATSEGWN